ncbi:MAG: hypothetical protein DRJ59_01085 [Thermoprotei archaeon]|nr:MAG: hypothetical protein DRJ59_01085 [Thermoprotei archaeon]
MHSIAIVGSDSLALQLALMLRKASPRRKIFVIPYPRETLGLIRESIFNPSSEPVLYSRKTHTFLGKYILANVLRITVRSPLLSIDLDAHIIETQRGSVKADEIIVSYRGDIRAIISSKHGEYAFVLNNLLSLKKFLKALIRIKDPIMIEGPPSLSIPLANLVLKMEKKAFLTREALEYFFDDDILHKMAKYLPLFSENSNELENLVRLTLCYVPKLNDYVDVDSSLKYSENVYFFGENVRTLEILTESRRVFITPDVIEKEMYTVLSGILFNNPGPRGFLEIFHERIGTLELVSIGLPYRELEKKFKLTSTKVSLSQGTTGTLKLIAERNIGTIVGAQLVFERGCPFYLTIDSLYPLIAMRIPAMEAYTLVVRSSRDIFEKDPLITALRAIIKKLYY